MNLSDVYFALFAASIISLVIQRYVREEFKLMMSFVAIGLIFISGAVFWYQIATAPPLAANEQGIGSIGLGSLLMSRLGINFDDNEHFGGGTTAAAKPSTNQAMERAKIIYRKPGYFMSYNYKSKDPRIRDPRILGGGAAGTKRA